MARMGKALMITHLEERQSGSWQISCTGRRVLGMRRTDD